MAAQSSILPGVNLSTLLFGEDPVANTSHIELRATFVSISASTAVLSAPGRFMGLFVTAASSTPTIKVWNNVAASGTVLLETFTPVASTEYLVGLSIESTIGIYVTISGTVTTTVFYKAGL